MERGLLVGRLQRDAGHAQPFRGLPQGSRVVFPLALTGDRVRDVAALDLELGAALEPIESGGELVVTSRQQVLGHRVLTGQDRSEAQWQDGHLGGGGVQDLPVGAQIIG